MSQEQMKEAFRTVIKAAYGAGKLEVLDDLFASDFVEHQADITPPTLEGVKRSIAYLRNAFPDMHHTIEEMHTDGDRLWARLSARGTQQGTFAGVPPTGSLKFVPPDELESQHQDCPSEGESYYVAHPNL